METLRLRRIQQQPSQLERLLTACVLRGKAIPKDCYRIRDSRALSSQLQAVVERAIKEGHVWACWADSDCAWLFTCEMSLALSRQRGAPVLDVHLYDQTGELKEAGKWVADPAENWRPYVD